MPATGLLEPVVIEDTTRREFITGVGAAALAAAFLAACGEDSAEGTSEWRYVDDRGREIVLDGAPRRVAALNICAAALWDFGVRPVAIWGPQTREDGTPDPQIGNVDLSQTRSMGETLSELDLEILTQVAPDVLVAPTFNGETLWPITEDATPLINEITRTVAVSVSARHSREIIETYERLASEFGVDAATPPIETARAAYEEALSALNDAAAAKPNLKVACISAGPSSFWIGNPDNQQDLLQAGLQLFDGGEYSWEQLGTIDADLILLDERSQWLQPADLAEMPTWQSHPAVVAGQVAPWTLSVVYSYQSYAPVVQRYADAVASADELT